jgi:O-antigen/teichoic acid export membrane protein
VNGGRHSVEGRFVRAAFWSVAAGVLSRAGTVVAHVIAARALGAHEYGKLGVLTSTALLVTPLAGLGLGLAVTKHVAERRERAPARAAAVVRLGLRAAWAGGAVGGVLLAGAALPVARSVLAAPELAPSLALIALWVPLACVSATQDAALTGLEAFRTVALWSTARGIVAAGSLAAGALLGGVDGCIVGLLIGEACAVWTGSRVLRSECARHGLEPHSGSCRSEAAGVFRLALTNLLLGAATVPAQWLPRVWLTRLPDGFSELGMFDAANRWALAIGFIPAFITSAQLPILARLAGGDRQDDYRRLRAVHLTVVTLGCLVPAALVALLAGPIMQLNGAGYREGAPVLIVLALSAVAVGLNMALGQNLVSRGLNRLRLLAGWLWAATLLGSAFPLIAAYGAAGLAIAQALAYSASSLALGLAEGWTSPSHGAPADSALASGAQDGR